MKKYNNIIKIIILITCFFLISECKNKDDSLEKEYDLITEISIGKEETVNIFKETIEDIITFYIQVPKNSKIKDVYPKWNVDKEVKSTPPSGVHLNFDDLNNVDVKITFPNETIQKFRIKTEIMDISNFRLNNNNLEINQYNDVINIISKNEISDNITIKPSWDLPKGAVSEPKSGVNMNLEKGDELIIKITFLNNEIITYKIKVLSSFVEIKTFSINGNSGVIDNINKTITVTGDFLNGVTNLSPDITISAEASISPNTGVSKNFTSPITYTVTAEDGSPVSYTVNVVVNPLISSDKQINTFSINGNSGVIDNINKTITVTGDFLNGVTNLSPNITISAEANISPNTGVSKNFTSSIIYTVTAEDGSQVDYTVNVVVNPPVLSLMIDNIQTGNISGKEITDFTLASNGADVMLLFSVDSEYKVYAVDIKDNNSVDAPGNTISGNVNNIKSNIEALLGWTNASVKNIEVNPISKAIYMLVWSQEWNSTNSAILKITNSGNTISVLALNNIEYVSFSVFSVNMRVSDMTFGDNKLFVSSRDYSGDNELAYFELPFTHNMTSTKQKTAMFKSNWDRIYHTDAPLDLLCYTETTNGGKRIMGQTMCVPSFSIPIQDITGLGTLNVIEYFRFGGGIPNKVISTSTGGKTYMFSLYNYTIYRIGEKYIDGSILNFSKLNENSTNLSSGVFPEEEVKLYITPSGYTMMSNYNNTSILVLDSNDVLSLLQL
ncbi:MAG: hypothetical protein HRT66_06315 [Flavobacteriaceae bacterium]|nr:hypothetical protein [Flavobacteriaceae bacterium]